MQPARSCIACRKRDERSNLLHLVVEADRVIPDPKQKMQGRGAWLHLQCFEVARQRGSFGRAFPGKSDLSLEVLKQYLVSNTGVNE